MVTLPAGEYHGSGVVFHEVGKWGEKWEWEDGNTFLYINKYVGDESSEVLVK